MSTKERVSVRVDIVGGFVGKGSVLSLLSSNARG